MERNSLKLECCTLPPYRMNEKGRKRHYSNLNVKLRVSVVPTRKVFVSRRDRGNLSLIRGFSKAQPVRGYPLAILQTRVGMQMKHRFLFRVVSALTFVSINNFP